MNMPLNFRRLAGRLAAPALVLAFGLPLSPETQAQAQAQGSAPGKLAMPLCINKHCGVIGMDGRVMLPFDNAYGAIYASRPGHAVFVAKPQGGSDVWRLVTPDGKRTLAGPY
jgi:hypothetical protein